MGNRLFGGLLYEEENLIKQFRSKKSNDSIQKKQYLELLSSATNKCQLFFMPYKDNFLDYL